MYKKLTISGLIIAMYIVLIYIFQGISFGPVQLRIANSLYALAAIYPFLVFPLGGAVILTNLLFGGLGIIDIICGFIVTTITCYIISKMGRTWAVMIPIILIPGLTVPLWLSLLLHIPYAVIMPGVVVGQIIPALTGALVIKRSGIKE